MLPPPDGKVVDTEATLFEETYGMKSKGMAASLSNTEYNMNIVPELQKQVQFNLFAPQGSQSVEEHMNAMSSALARDLSVQICATGSTDNMLRFYFLGICNGVVNYGIGAQTQAVKVRPSNDPSKTGGGLVVEKLYPGSVDLFDNEMGRGGPVRRIDYANGGLGRKLGGYTQSLFHSSQIIMDDDNAIKSRGGSSSSSSSSSSSTTKSIAQEAKDSQKRLWSNPASDSSGVRQACELVRAMVYYNSCGYRAEWEHWKSSWDGTQFKLGSMFHTGQY